MALGAAKRPFFSIVIPLFNKKEQIAQTLQSVLNQSFNDYEIIVIDDGSSDGSLDVVSYIAPDAICQIQANKGAGEARNTGISLAQGDYVAFLDADDYWAPNKLEIQANYLRDNPSVRWCASNFVVVRLNQQERVSEDIDAEGWISVTDWFEFNQYTDRILTSGVVVARDVLDEVGGFDVSIASGQDIDLWIRIALLHPSYGYYSQPLFRYLHTVGSISRTSDKKTAGALTFLRKHIPTSLASGNSNYQKIVNRKCLYLMRYALTTDHADVFHSAKSLMPDTWRTSKTFWYSMISFLPFRLRSWVLGRRRALKGIRQ